MMMIPAQGVQDELWIRLSDLDPNAGLVPVLLFNETALDSVHQTYVFDRLV